MYVCVHESLERFFVVTFMNKYIALRYKSRSDVFIAFLYFVCMFEIFDYYFVWMVD